MSCRDGEEEVKSTLCRPSVGQTWGKADGSVLIRWEAYIQKDVRNGKLDVFIYTYIHLQQIAVSRYPVTLGIPLARI